MWKLTLAQHPQQCFKQNIDSLKAPSCVKERTPLTLVPIHDVNFFYNDIHEVSTLPIIIDVEIVQKNI